MSLCYREQRQLRGIEAGLFRSDSHLAGMLDVFGRLYRGQDMPASEQVPSRQDRDRRAVTRIALPDVFRGIGIDPIKPGNGSLLLGHLPAPPRLWLQPDPVVGRHLPAAAYCRVLAGRAGLGLSVGPFRRAPVRHRRHGGRRGLVPAAGPAPRRLRLLAVRPCHVAERDRHGAVRLPGPGRRHEQPAARPARAPEPGWRKNSRTPARCCPSGSSSR